MANSHTTQTNHPDLHGLHPLIARNKNTPLELKRFNSDYIKRNYNFWISKKPQKDFYNPKIFCIKQKAIFIVKSSYMSKLAFSTSSE